MRWIKEFLQQRRERREWEDSQRVTQQQLVVELRRLNTMLYCWHHSGLAAQVARGRR